MKQQIAEGQISLFDLPKEILQPKEVVTKPAPKANNFDKIINQYKDTCNRIFIIENKMYVELKDKTIQFHQDGEPGRIFDIDMFLRPKDEILIANEYRPITEKQIKTICNKIQADKFIKRKCDKNILIQYDNFCIAIYPNGHFEKWKSPAKYNSDEIYSIEEIKNINKINEKINGDLNGGDVTELDGTFKIGDKVSFDYNGPKIGIIVRIYNKGETINVCWENKQTAFYYKSVTKINT